MLARQPRLKHLLRRALPRALSPQRILGGPLRGRQIVTSWHDYPAAILGRTERPLLDWFARNVCAEETWLDVGAQYGYTALALCGLVGPKGRVFAFEPMVRTAGCLAETGRLNRMEQLVAVPLALAAPDTLELRQLPAVRGMVDSTLARGGWQETFLAARLDWLWPRLCGNAPKIDGIKMDTQGMELEALRGMRELLVAHRPKLVVEIHRGVRREEVFALLAGAGYPAQGEPVTSTNGSGGQPEEISYAFRAAA
jgi:FkbM family methyltransferase